MSRAVPFAVPLLAVVLGGCHAAREPHGPPIASPVRPPMVLVVGPPPAPPVLRDPPPRARDGECADDQNADAEPMLGCSQGAQWIAWRYVPARDLSIERVELFTQSASVAFLADAGERPGEALAPAAAARGPGDGGWSAVHFDPPVRVEEERVYWIAARQQQCSVAASGTSQPYFGSFGSLAGDWEGPHRFDDRRWMARIRGRCE